jgi:hypothetical protein
LAPTRRYVKGWRTISATNGAYDSAMSAPMANPTAASHRSVGKTRSHMFATPYVV